LNRNEVNLSSLRSRSCFNYYIVIISRFVREKKKKGYGFDFSICT